MNKYALVLVSVVTLSTSTFAGALKAPFSMPSAAVLPKAVRNLSDKVIFTEVTEKLSGSTGQAVALGEAFSQAITFQDVIDSKDPGIEQDSIEFIMQELGSNPGDVLGITTGQLNMDVIVQAPVLAWGLSDSFTLALAVPVVQYSYNVDTGVIQSDPQLIQRAAGIASNSGAEDSAQEVLRKMNNPALETMKEKGYDPLVDDAGTKLGDIKLVGKYMAYKTEIHAFSTQLEITFPTGEEYNTNKVVDVASGDGQYDVGISLNHDWSFTPRFTLHSMVSYTNQFATTLTKRIPEKRKSTLTADIDPNTKMNLGNMYGAQTGLSYRLSGVTVGTSYGFQYKSSDVYEGSLYASERYLWLGKDSEQNMHSVHAVLSYDTIDLFKAKKFPIPLKMAINHVRVVKGKNVVSDPLTALDFSMFF